MTDSSGAIMRNMAKVLPDVDYLRIEVRDCDLNLGQSKEPGARLFADHCRQWQMMEADKAVSAVQLGQTNGQTSTACLLVNSDASLFEDVSITVMGKGMLDGSIYASNVSLSFKDGSMAELEMVKADSILVTAFDGSSITIKNAEAARILVIAVDETSVTVENSTCDIILVRQHKLGQVAFIEASELGNESPGAAFALSGNRDLIRLPQDPNIVPQDIVDDYWRLLEAVEAK